MRLGTITTPEGTRAGVIRDGSVELLAAADAGDVIRRLSDGGSLSAIKRVGEIDLADADFTVPIAAPSKVLCVGLNFYEHAAEANLAIPNHPLLFAKYPSSLIGPRDEIVIPPETEKCDWEAELALVIGRRVRRIAREDALSAVAGYTVLNDITMRDWQKHTSQFLPGKTFEASTPYGPWIVSGDEIDEARDLKLECLVNGEVMQSMTTGGMIFDASAVVAYLSHVLTLEPGDVIALGTPSGIGSARTPSIFLQAGDRVVTRVEGIGELDNMCVAEQVSVVPAW